MGGDNSIVLREGIWEAGEGGGEGFHLKDVGERSTGELHGREWDGMRWDGMGGGGVGGREVAFEQPELKSQQLQFHMNALGNIRAV